VRRHDPGQLSERARSERDPRDPPERKRRHRIRSAGQPTRPRRGGVAHEAGVSGNSPV
jgi:hypothetical protein